jgi:uncharacterized protein (DUF305 family)
MEGDRMMSNTRRTAGRRAALLGAAVAMLATPAQAIVIEGVNPERVPFAQTVFVAVSEAAQRADRDYVAGMRPHHVGALTMSQAYLSDSGRSSPLLQQLSRAIAANQTFEIAVLDDVSRNLDLPPAQMPFGVRLQPVATIGLGDTLRFIKTPIPSRITWAIGPVSEADVRFAKAMIVHHEGAVQMARAYHANPNARNPFLHKMNVDVITDQTQEIALLRAVIAAFPGDASRIEVDPSMIHGMEGMDHGAHGHAPSAPPMPAAAPARRAAPHVHHH